jgi:hypothetical protein
VNDYISGGLARERQADYLRQVERDELAALVHRARADRAAAIAAPASTRVVARRHHRWRDLLGHLHLPGPHAQHS